MTDGEPKSAIGTGPNQSPVVFSQVQLEPAGLLRAAQLTNRTLREPIQLDVLAFDGDTLALKVRDQSLVQQVRLRQRPTTDDDQAHAVQAEARGRAAGMSLLAARCPHLWEIEAKPETSPTLVELLCAVLAGFALGPVMPADHSTLYGVRGARTRAGV